MLEVLIIILILLIIPIFIFKIRNNSEKYNFSDTPKLEGSALANDVYKRQGWISSFAFYKEKDGYTYLMFKVGYLNPNEGNVTWLDKNSTHLNVIPTQGNILICKESPEYKSHMSTIKKTMGIEYECISKRQFFTYCLNQAGIIEADLHILMVQYLHKVFGGIKDYKISLASDGDKNWNLCQAVTNYGDNKNYSEILIVTLPSSVKCLSWLDLVTNISENFIWCLKQLYSSDKNLNDTGSFIFSRVHGLDKSLLKILKGPFQLNKTDKTVNGKFTSENIKDDYFEAFTYDPVTYKISFNNNENTIACTKNTEIDSILKELIDPSQKIVNTIVLNRVDKNIMYNARKNILNDFADCLNAIEDEEELLNDNDIHSVEQKLGDLINPEFVYNKRRQLEKIEKINGVTFYPIGNRENGGSESPANLTACANMRKEILKCFKHIPD